MVQCTPNILSQRRDPDKEQREEFLHETFGRKRKYFHGRYLARKYKLRKNKGNTKNSPRGTFFSLVPQQPFCSPFEQWENIDDWIISIRLVNWNWENWRNRLNHFLHTSTERPKAALTSSGGMDWVWSPTLSVKYYICKMTKDEFPIKGLDLLDKLLL